MVLNFSLVLVFLNCAVGSRRAALSIDRGRLLGKVCYVSFGSRSFNFRRHAAQSRTFFCKLETAVRWLFHAVGRDLDPNKTNSVFLSSRAWPFQFSCGCTSFQCALIVGRPCGGFQFLAQTRPPYTIRAEDECV